MSEQIVPQEEAQVKCTDGCEKVLEDYIFGDLPPYGCGCVLPGQHCPDCEAAARALHDGDELPF